MKTPTIVSESSQIDPDWLTTALNYAGMEGRVTDMTAESIGTGQVGENVRFTLTGDGVPDTVVGKFPSTDPVSKKTGIELGNYITEVFFYKTLQQTVDITTPTVYFTDINTETHDFVILMEDLAPGQQGDQLAGCDADQAALAMEELARLQGPRWGDKTLMQYELLGGANTGSQDGNQGLYQMLQPGFLERYDRRLDSHQQSIVDRVGQRLDRYNSLYEGPPGLVHIDYRLDNMMFGGPYPLAVVDWQSIKLGCPIADASYFLGTSLPPDIRAAEEKHLLGLYLDVLKSYDVDMDRDTAFALYRNYAPGGLIMAVIASMIVGETARGNDMFMAMATRSIQMCDDLDAA